jgi:hypothetical protein
MQGPEGFSYGCTVVPSHAVSFLNLELVKAALFLS